MSATVLSPPARPEESHRIGLSPVERAVLLTLVYGDLFDYPLNEDELRRFLPVAATDAEIADAVAALDGARLSREDGFYCLRGREEIVATRRRRAALAGRRWRAARGFASWLGGVPFLRMVAVCGSQAVDNGDDDGDVDLFLITEPRRLWLVQSVTMVLRRLGRLRFGVEICPNFLTTRDNLEVDDKNLYVAREIAQAVPLWGEEDHRRFVDANRWIARYLPRLDLGVRRRAAVEISRPRARRLVEQLLGGRLGGWLDRAVYRALLVYYRVRLRRRFAKDDVERAYRPDRQALVTGGYAGIVARRFLERAREVLEAAGDDVTGDELRRCFFGADAGPVAADPHFAGIFAARYGSRP